MLNVDYTPRFQKDIKILKRKRVDFTPLREVIDLISRNDAASRQILVQRHRMHHLKGEFLGAWECHVANLGDWLLVWRVQGDMAVLLRTGTHDQIFR